MDIAYSLNHLRSEYDYIFPDEEKTIQYNSEKSSSFANLDTKVYCLSAIFDKIKKRYPEIKGKLVDFVLDSKFDERMFKNNRDIKQSSGLGYDYYRFLISAASFVRNGNKVVIFSNDKNLRNAYCNLIKKNTYFNQDNFGFFGNNDGCFKRNWADE
jgi:hypothetical protein